MIQSPTTSLAQQIIVSGGFDDIKSRDLRFLEEAAKLGELTVLLWPDATLQKLTGKPPKFPLAERLYFLNAVRYVSRVIDSRSARPATILCQKFARRCLGRLPTDDKSCA